MKKRLIHTTRLKFFQDDATGYFGVASELTVVSDSGFNSLWNDIGIFHDVFEHYFENNHKYFKNDFALNQIGECVAMGAAMYYYDTLGIYNRTFNKQRYFMQEAREVNESAIIEAVSEGYSHFGQELLCSIPDQRTVDNHEVEYQINELWKNIKDIKINTQHEQHNALLYKNSVALWKIRNAYRYGYHMAEKLIPENYDNRETCVDFIKFWDEFTKNNGAEELTTYFDCLEFKVYKDQENRISWNSTLIGKKDIPNIKIKNQFYIIKELYCLLAENENY